MTDDRSAYRVSPDAFYRDFDDLANITGERPLVQRVKENTSRIRSLDLKFYAILAGVISAQVVQVLVRWTPN